jgi:hypothetical protein
MKRFQHFIINNESFSTFHYHPSLLGECTLLRKSEPSYLAEEEWAILPCWGRVSHLTLLRKSEPSYLAEEEWAIFPCWRRVSHLTLLSKSEPSFLAEEEGVIFPCWVRVSHLTLLCKSEPSFLDEEKWAILPCLERVSHLSLLRKNEPSYLAEEQWAMFGSVKVRTVQLCNIHALQGLNMAIIRLYKINIWHIRRNKDKRSPICLQLLIFYNKMILPGRMLWSTFEGFC